jgi:hypothetical protein
LRSSQSFSLTSNDLWMNRFLWCFISSIPQQT